MCSRVCAVKGAVKGWLQSTQRHGQIGPDTLRVAQSNKPCFLSIVFLLVAPSLRFPPIASAFCFVPFFHSRSFWGSLRRSGSSSSPSSFVRSPSSSARNAMALSAQDRKRPNSEESTRRARRGYSRGERISAARTGARGSGALCN